MLENNFIKDEILKKISLLFGFDEKYGLTIPETIEIKSIENAKFEIIKESHINDTIYLEDILEEFLKSEEGRIALIKAFQKNRSN
ncbi:MAG: hypothetical protein RSC62_09570 [Cetobacterium sp.]|uniref:hypothetical protein n=1 Tax=Cetobacterium sp. TaxID=2071632 RepID=UPI002FC801FD